MMICNRITFLALCVFLSIKLNGQIQRYSPSNDGLRISQLELYGSEYLAVTQQPYFLRIDKSALNQTGFVDFPQNFRVENLSSLGDTILYEWKQPIAGGSTAVFYTKNLGLNWSLHPRLRVESAKLRFFDSLFVVDGDYALSRYTLNGGRTYNISLAGSKILGEDKDGVFLRKPSTDSLVYISSNGPQNVGVLDSSLGDLSRAKKAGGHYFLFHNWRDLVELDSNFNFVQVIHEFGVGDRSLFNSFMQGDTLVFTQRDSIVYSFNGGQSWLVDRVDAPLNRNRNCLAFSSGKLIYSHGSGTLLYYDLSTATSALNGQNHYPNLFSLSQAGPYFHGLEPIKLQGANQSLSIFHRLDQQGNPLDSTMVPFASPQAGSLMAFKDSSYGVFADLGKFYHTKDGGRSWQYNEDPDSAQYARIRFSRNGDCLYAYGGTTTSGFFLARLDSVGARSPLNFSLTLNEKVQDIIFSSCDSGLVLTNVDVYRTIDGGQSFQATNQGYIPLWRYQFKDDTIFLAARDKNYYSKGALGPFIPIASQPLYNSFRSSGAYFFFNAHQLINFDGDEGKFRIADTRYSFNALLDMPVDVINEFIPSDSGAIAIGIGGQFYSLKAEDLFPKGIGFDRSKLPLAYELYPNPFEDVIYIEGEGFNRFQVRALNGALLKEGKFASMISLSDLPAGLYMLVLIGGNGGSTVHDLILKS